MDQIQEVEDRVKLKLKNKKLRFKFPLVDDMEFQSQVSEKKEFQFKYEGKVDDVSTMSKELCSFKDNEFKLAPHQEFVKRFMHPNTPYNGILLYHGLGSGKTCSAIGIAEQYRITFQNREGFKKIMIIASPNVQQNFKLQLFDESKLKRINNEWNISTCVGSQLLHELKDERVQEMSKETLVKRIESIISSSYKFMGYGQLANNILKMFQIDDEITGKKREKMIMQRLKKKYENTMIVIDEAHNIRKSNDRSKSDNKRVASAIVKLFSYIQHIKLVLLTGTPMYDDPREIVFLLNILNMNDGRSIMKYSEVFDSNGYTTDKGLEKLREKMNGYISYVRGENPYSFPFKVFPNNTQSFKSRSIKSIEYPRIQYNDKEIEKTINYLDLFMNELGPFQKHVYEAIIKENKKYIVDNIEDQMETSCDSDALNEKENAECNDKTTNKKNILIDLLSALNISYPYFKDQTQEFIIGKQSLKHLMRFDEDPTTKRRSNFEYKEYVTERIFDHDNIENYSSKFKSLGDIIKTSDGIILVYSQFIDAGLIPIALMLEEMGFKRANGYNLLKKPKNMNYNLSSVETEFKQAKYCIISGDKGYSPNNSAELRMATSNDNINGENVKVVLVSQAGSEGLDFKNLRQVHIIDPWYNMNRIEQIIGRAVRNCSHKSLDLSNRNVQIFLYGSFISDDIHECIDLYIYRNAETKSMKIGRITRMMKEMSIDCLLNHEQQNFLEDNMNQTVQITLSSGDIVDYKVGDKPFTSLCDYMDNCEYTCINKNSQNINTSSYTFLQVNNDKIIKSIKHLFELKHVYTKAQIVDYINKKYKNIQEEEINMSLDMIVNDENIYIIDKYLRKGSIVNYDKYYIYQPVELKDDMSIVEDSVKPAVYRLKGLISQFRRSNNDDNQDDYEPNITEIQKELSKEVSIPQSPSSFSKKEVRVIDTIRDKIHQSTIQIEGKAFKEYQDSFEKSFKNIIYIMNEKFPNDHISEDMAMSILIGHICDTLNENDTKIFISYLISNEMKGQLDIYDKIALNYYAKYIINDESNRFIVLPDTKAKMKAEKIIIMKFDLEKERLIEAKKQEYSDHLDQILNITQQSNAPLGEIIGFMENYGKENTLSLKCREPYLNKKPGAFIENKSPKDIVPIINNILNNSSFLDVKKGKAMGLVKYHLVYIVEILLRQKDINQENGRRHLFSNFEKVFIQNVLVK